jgi:hypothetical protein
MLVQLAAKTQSANNHALMGGLVAGLIAGGVIALILGFSGAMDAEYTRRTIFIGIVLTVAGALMYKVIYT